MEKNTINQLQPQDAGIIAIMKKLYRKYIVGRAVDLIESSVTAKTCDMDLRSATQAIYNTWHGFYYEIIRKCWLRTRLADSDDGN